MFEHTAFTAGHNNDKDKGPVNTRTYHPPHNFRVKDLTRYSKHKLLGSIYHYDDDPAAPIAFMVNAFCHSNIRDLRVFD